MPILKLTSTNPIASFTLSEETPLFRIKRFRFEPDDAIEHQQAYSQIKLVYVKRVKPQLRTKSGDLTNSRNLSDEISPYQKDTLTEVDWVLNSAEEHDYDQIELSLENSGEKEISLELWYETQEIHPFTAASQGFKEHIDQNGNTKILFSAPFGTGKTTFLREYFKENKEYEVFHLFPVNYSVATNEDIFKYIKVELLFSLLEREVEFDMESFSKSMTLPFYLRKHAHELLLPFVRLLPKVGKSIHAIINDLLKLVKDFESHHAISQIDDKGAAEDFIKEVYEKEGSLFEENFYTQLIRQLIEQTQAKGKKTVLILDDLDRIDPEHIFRILNVFAAHVDRQGFPDEMANKFGFDRIILVCHYDNLKKIFQHKYGQDTDFSGYMDKYFSQAKYEFDSEEVVSILINKSLASIPTSLVDFLHLVLLDFIADEVITLREILKISNLNYKISFTSAPHVFTCINYLHQLSDIDSVISRIRKCRYSNKLASSHNVRYKHHDLFEDLVMTLLFYRNKGSNERKYKLNEFEIRIKVDYHIGQMRLLESKTYLNNEEVTNKIFSKNEFYQVLNDVAESYKSIGGLKGFAY